MLVFLDIETTGLSPKSHEIIEFGAVREDGNELDIKIKAQHIETAEPKALEINHYDPVQWENALAPAQAIGIINEFVKGHVPVGHNIHFDLKFIEALMEEYNVLFAASYHHLDTVTLVWEHLKPLGQRRVSLVNVCETLGISNEGAHSALVDAKRCQQVYLKLTQSTPDDKAAWAEKIKSLL